MNTPKRILFMPSCMSLAHVGRLLQLAKSIQSIDTHVAFALDESHHHFLPPHVTRCPATSLRSADLRRRLERGQPLIDAPLLRLQVEEDLGLFRDIRPNLVIGDFRPSLAISSPINQIPFMNVVNAHWSPWSRESFQLPGPVTPLKYLGFCLGKECEEALLPLGFALHSRPFNTVRKEYGLPPVLEGLRGIYTAGDYVAYADLAEMVPTPGAPTSHRHIGPVLWEPSSDLPVWWDELPKDKPIVYVSAGSTGRTDFLPKILEALAELPVAVAVATSGRAKVTPVPGRVFVADYLPGLAICRRASLVINNGGAGGVYQAMKAGVPVMGIAANMDQCMVMKSIERIGAGKLVFAGESMWYAWKKEIESLLGSHATREAAIRFSRRLVSQRTGEIFANWVDHILGRTVLIQPTTEHRLVGSRR